MNLGTIRTEVRARGHEELETSLLNTWINYKYNDLCERMPWPFLTATYVNTGPTLTIADLGHVLQVSDLTTETALDFVDWRDVMDLDPAISDTGDPLYYTLGEDVSTVVPYPTTTNAISVTYTKTPVDLVADSDTPLIPTRYHYLLVYGTAAIAAERDRQPELAAEMTGLFEQGIALMTNALFFKNYDSGRFITGGRHGSSSTDW